MSLTRRTFLYGAAAGRGAASAAPRRPRAWPTRPLRIIIPTAPGGSPDLVARMLGSKLTERLGQPVVVESVTQGVGLVGNQMVSQVDAGRAHVRDADRRLHDAGRGDEDRCRTIRSAISRS